MDEWQRHETFKETFKAMMILPVEGLKIICWINGGAAIAVLTYVGNFAAKSSTAQLQSIRPAIMWYCAGLSAGAITFLISYLVQLSFFRSLHRKSPLLGIKTPHRLLVGVGCVLSLFGVLSFIMGSLSAASALAP